jgi:hypothetical protein
MIVFIPGVAGLGADERVKKFLDDFPGVSKAQVVTALSPMLRGQAERNHGDTPSRAFLLRPAFHLCRAYGGQDNGQDSGQDGGTGDKGRRSGWNAGFGNAKTTARM